MLDAVRERADPVQHRLIAPHVTLCREDELTGATAADIRGRLAGAGPITLGFGRPEGFDGHGVWLPCHDGREAFHQLRMVALGRPDIRTAKAHITLAHPRNPVAPGNVPATFAALAAPLEIRFAEAALIEQQGGQAWRVVDTIPLEDGDRVTPARIETSRLVLRPPGPADAESIYARYASVAAVTRYLGWPRHQSLDDTHAFLAFSSAAWARWPAGPYLMLSRIDGQVVGSTGLDFQSAEEAATGYVLAEDAWGRGLATEALAAMVAVARQVGVARLIALCHPEHRVSQRVLTKGGFGPDDPSVSPIEFPNLAPGVAVPALRYVRRLDR